jgi:leucyl aminopeptidase (aminopeptidase T)
MDERLERYAELVVRIGINVQPGQEVFLYPAVEHYELARALSRTCTSTSWSAAPSSRWTRSSQTGPRCP